MQVGGPDGSFKGGALASGYYNEAGFGVTSAVDQSSYGQGKPNISRALFKGYDAVKHSTTPRRTLAASFTIHEAIAVREQLELRLNSGDEFICFRLLKLK